MPVPLASTCKMPVAPTEHKQKAPNIANYFGEEYAKKKKKSFPIENHCSRLNVCC